MQCIHLSFSFSRARRTTRRCSNYLLLMVVLVLLTFFILLPGVTVSAFSPDFLSSVSSLFRVPDGPRDLWRQSPDPSVSLPADVPWERWHQLRPMDQRKLLTRLGIPFSVDIGDEWGLSCLLYTLLFLPEHTGMCPNYSPHNLFFLVHPEERDRRYGIQRLRELHRYFRLDNIWRDISSDEQRYRNPSDDRVIALEHAIINKDAEEAYGPAVLPVTLFSVVLYRVSLLDLGAAYTATSSNLEENSSTTPSRRLTLTIDALQSLRRRAEWQRVKQKYEYQEGVHALNAMLLQLEESSLTVFKKGMEAYDREKREKEFLRQSLRELRERIIPEREAEKKMRQRQAAESLVAERAAKQKTRHEMVCYQLYRASETLGIQHTQQDSAEALGRTTIDYRYKTYFLLLNKHGCHQVVSTMQQRQKEDGDNQKEEFHFTVSTLKKDKDKDEDRTAIAPPEEERRLVDVCEHLQQFQQWTHSTGMSHSVSQSFVLLLTLYAVHHPRNVQPDRTVDEGQQQEVVDLVAGILPFDAEDFIQFISRGIRDGTVASTAQRCGTEVAQIAPSVMSELWYVLASTELIFQPDKNMVKKTDGSHHWDESPQMTPEEIVRNTRRALGVLHLYQSLWYGSRQAASTLGTLREHGMFVPQNEKVAAHLLEFSYMDTLNDMLFQLLSQYAGNLGRLLLSGSIPRLGAGLSPSAFAIPQLPSQQKVIPLGRLLRYEWFDVTVDGWESVDQPYTNYDMVMGILALEDDESEDDSEDEDGNHNNREETVSDSKQLDNLQLLKSTIWLSGWHGISRNTQQSECQLLTLLRRRGYLCDMDNSRYGVHISRNWGNVCPAYMHALSSGAVPLPCGWRASWIRTRNPHHFWPQTCTREAYLSVQQALLALSYVYLMEQRFDASAFYAMLSVEFSFTAYKSAVALIKAFPDEGGSSRASGSEDRPLGEGHRWLVEQLHRNTSTITSSHPQGKSAQKRGSSDLKSPWKRERVPSYVSSPFATLRPLTLLGLNGMLGALSEQGDISPVGSRVAYMIRETLQYTFGVVGTKQRMTRISRQSAENRNSSTSSGPRSSSTPDLTEVFMVLLAAAANEESENKILFFDRQLRSIHRIDAFVGLLWLIREFQLSSPSASASTNWASSPSVLWNYETPYKALFANSARFHAFMPDVSDSWLRYACRLGGFATRLHREAAVSMLNQLNMSCSAMSMLHYTKQNFKSDARSNSIHQLDRFPYQTALWDLRGSQLYQANAASAAPLWYATDLDMYLTKSGYTFTGRLWDTLINSLYYLFTDTTTETAFKKFTKSILPEREGTPREGEEVAAALTTRKLFLDAFERSQEVRHFTVALFLVTRALTLGGSPQGFSLIFYAAEPHVTNAGQPNRYLWPLCHFLAFGLWGRHTTLSMWREEHYVAQWQMEKPAYTRYLPHRIFSQDHHTPFPYAIQEVRQELMAALNRWTVRTLHRHESVVPPTAGEHEMAALSSSTSIKQQLLLCSGYLLFLQDVERGEGGRRAGVTAAEGVGGGPTCTAARISSSPSLHGEKEREGKGDQESVNSFSFPVRPYAGSFLPAADLGCLQDLLSGKYVKLEKGERESLTDYLHLVATQNQRFYGLAAEKDDDPLPPSGAKFCDAPPSSAASKVDKSSKEKSTEGRHSYFLVEPWRRTENTDEPWATLKIGDGVFFNQRLHRVTGSVWASNILWLRNKVLRWLGR